LEGHGNAYLVANSQFHLNNIGCELENDEVNLHMNIAKLVTTLTGKQRELLADIMKLIVDVNVKQDLLLHKPNKKHNWYTNLPTSMKDIRSMYSEGKYAILPNLPRPQVTIIDNHAYVSIKECVADLLGHGVEVDVLNRTGWDSIHPEVSKISESRRGQQIVRNCEQMHCGDHVLCLFANEWSDDFEPSYSIKGNRGSAWIKTITISPPHTSLHSLTHTYPIAIGRKGSSHEAIEQRLAEELLDLSLGGNQFYHGGLKKNVKVHLELFVSLQDQPERRSANYIMLGSSTYTARWGYAVDFHAIASGVPPCPACWQSLLSPTATECGGSRTCTECVNWDLSCESCLLDYSPPTGYPPEMIPTSGKLRPLRLDYKVMKEAVTMAHNELVSGNWSIENAKVYLRVHGINSEAVSAITECANNCQTYNELKSNAEHDPEAFHVIQTEFDENPELFTQWQFPAFWERGVDLHQHIDVAMHLLFLGVVKTTIKKIQEWIKKRNKYQSFLSYASGTFEAIQALGLDWCRVIPYGAGKLGGWVSENYLAACRLMCWFYCQLDDIAEDIVYSPPDRPQHKWTVVHNRGWLMARGLDAQGNSQQLRDRVNQYMSDPAGPPPIRPPEGGPVRNVVAVISALKAMISRLMCNTVTEAHIADTERHIRIFLSCMEKFDEGMRASTDKPTWVTSYNFVCLLNLPDVMREFGPLRNLWEGGGQGEKVLSMVKPHWHGYGKNWQQNMMEKLLKHMAMNRVTLNQMGKGTKSWDIHDLAMETDEEDEAECTYYGKKYVVYRNELTVRRKFEGRQPLSAVGLTDGKMVCVVGKNSYLELHCTRFSETMVGASYHHWEMGNLEALSGHLNDQVSSYCLLLPKLKPTGLPAQQDEAIFTVITSEWWDMQEDQTIAVHHYIDAQYTIEAT